MQPIAPLSQSLDVGRLSSEPRFPETRRFALDPGIAPVATGSWPLLRPSSQPDRSAHRLLFERALRRRCRGCLDVHIPLTAVLKRPIRNSAARERGFRKGEVHIAPLAFPKFTISAYSNLACVKNYTTRTAFPLLVTRNRVLIFFVTCANLVAYRKPGLGVWSLGAQARQREFKKIRKRLAANFRVFDCTGRIRRVISRLPTIHAMWVLRNGQLRRGRDGGGEWSVVVVGGRWGSPLGRRSVRRPLLGKARRKG